MAYRYSNNIYIEINQGCSHPPACISYHQIILIMACIMYVKINKAKN